MFSMHKIHSYSVWKTLPGRKWWIRPDDVMWPPFDMQYVVMLVKNRTLFKTVSYEHVLKDCFTMDLYTLLVWILRAFFVVCLFFGFEDCKLILFWAFNMFNVLNWFCDVRPLNVAFFSHVLCREIFNKCPTRNRLMSEAMLLFFKEISTGYKIQTCEFLFKRSC